MREKEKNLTVRLDEPSRMALEKLTREMQRSRGAVIRMLLAEAAKVVFEKPQEAGRGAGDAN